MGIFNPENSFWSFMGKVADVFFLSVLWLLLSLPLVTAGAATVSALQFTLKQVRDEEGYLARSYFKAFKANFLQGTLLWLITLVLLVFFFLDFYALFSLPALGLFRVPLFSLLLVLFLLFLIDTMYVYPLVALYRVKTKKAMHDALIMGFQHPFFSLLLVLLWALAALAVWYAPPFFFIFIALAFFFSSFLLRRVFSSYEPEPWRS
jgi:Protein of unknown function, DUF624.